MNRQDIEKMMEAYNSVVSEKTLTPAEKKKREEIAKAMEKDNPDMPMDKKMAIATAQAKKVAEATGKDIAAKMMKSKSMKAFAPKVSKMANVSAGDLEKMLPDYVPGAEIRKLFEEVELEEVELREENLSDMEKQALKSALGFGGAADPKYKKVIEKLKKMGYVKDIELQKGIISPEQDTYYYNLTPKGKKIAMMKEELEEANRNHPAAKKLMALAKEKDAGSDAKDYEKAAQMIMKGDAGQLGRFISKMDSYPRDAVIAAVKSTDKAMYDKMTARMESVELDEKSCGKDRMKKESDDEDKKLDPVNKKAVKKDFDDRDDKDIDNDGDVDDSDEYLHKRRKAVGKAMDKEKKGGTAEISKIGEAFEDLWSALEEAANPKKGATPPEGLSDKESPKSKEFIAKHTVDLEDEEKTHQTATDAGRATKPAPARPGDNKAGDKNIVNPVKGAVKEDTRTYQQKIMDILSGKTWGEIADNVDELKNEE